VLPSVRIKRFTATYNEQCRLRSRVFGEAVVGRKQVAKYVFVYIMFIQCTRRWSTCSYM